jgi:hypothetical protein
MRANKMRFREALFLLITKNAPKRANTPTLWSLLGLLRFGFLDALLALYTHTARASAIFPKRKAKKEARREMIY